MTRRRRGKLELDPAVVRKARSLARKAGKPIVTLAKTHTTVSVERAVLRLAGLSGADSEGEPWVNHVVDAVREDVGLEHGVALPVWHAMASGEYADLTALAQKAAAGGVHLPPARGARRRAGPHGVAQGGGRRPAADRQQPQDPRPDHQAGTATRPSRGST